MVDVSAAHNSDGGDVSLFDKTLCLVLSKGQIGTSRKAKGSANAKAAEAVEADTQMVSLNKKLFKAPEYKAVKEVDGAYEAFMASVTLPSMLKPGIYAIAHPLVEKVDERTKQYIAERKAAVAVLAAAWDRIVNEAAKPREEGGLGPLFDAMNYPAAEDLQARFYVEYRWIGFGVPQQLHAIKASIWTEERAKAQADVASAKDAAIQDIRARALKLVAHVADRLTPDGDGKRKVFHDSMLKHVKDFVDLFPALNTATGDQSLVPVVERARLALQGIDSKILRDDELVRRKVQEEFAAVQLALDGMITTKTRKIQIEAEEEEVA